MFDWIAVKRLLSPVAAPQSAERDNHRDLLASLLVMAWLVEARDPYTGGHLWRVSRFAELVAEAAGLPGIDVSRIAIGGFLHDLGKVGVPDAILRKPDRLTDAEFDIMRTHPEVGVRMLAGHPLAALARNAVLLHHERPDGRGYPRGLAGDAIPVDARIIGLCDAFDAMTSARPYRAAMPIADVLDIIRKALGTQFDEGFGVIFLELGAQGTLDHIVGHSDDGIPLRTCLMCGPTLVARREDQAGGHLFCRNCGGEYVLHETDSGELDVAPTGHRGAAGDLVAEADTTLILRLIQEVAGRIPLPQLLASIPT